MAKLIIYTCDFCGHKDDRLFSDSEPVKPPKDWEVFGLGLNKYYCCGRCRLDVAKEIEDLQRKLNRRYGVERRFY